MNYSFSFLELARQATTLFPGRRIAVEPYSYTLTFPGRVGSGDVQASKTLKSNCNFLAASGSFAAFTNAGVPVSSLEDTFIQIQNEGSNERFFADPVPVLHAFSGVYGVVAEPSAQLFAIPKLIHGNATLAAVLNWSTVAGLTLGGAQLALHGVNIYDYE